MVKKAKRGKRAVSLESWSEVWTKVGDQISERMATKDWVKASRACKEMSKVQPRQVEIAPDSSAALCWLVKHWSQAKVLELTLNQLPVGRPHRADREESGMASWEAGDVIDRVANLLFVQSLRLEAKEVHSISTFTQLPLRHLQLQLTNTESLTGLTKLGELALLETLMVKCYDEPHSWFLDPDGVVLPKMDLRACTKLHAVAFHVSIPEDLEVLPGCSVNLVGACSDLADLRSLCSSCKCVAHEADEVPQFLGANFTALTSLKIEFFGCPIDSDEEDVIEPPLEVQLGEHVKHLTSFSIQAGLRDINLDILGSKQLTSLEVLTEHQLKLNISDVAGLAAALQMYRIKCDTHFSEHAKVQALHSAVESLKKGNCQVLGSRPDSGFGVLRYELCWVSKDAGIDARDVEDHLACSCSACWKCLKRAGAFDRLLVQR